MKAVKHTTKQNTALLQTLRLHIGMGIEKDVKEDNSLDLQIRIAEIEAEFNKMLKSIESDCAESFDEAKAERLLSEKALLEQELVCQKTTGQRDKQVSRLDEINKVLESIAERPISYDDSIVRAILDSVIVESKEKIRVVFKGGYEVEQGI